MVIILVAVDVIMDVVKVMVVKRLSRLIKDQSFQISKLLANNVSQCHKETGIKLK